MVTLLLLLMFVAFYLFYNTSQKAELSRTYRLERWAQDHLLASKGIGLAMFLLALCLCIVHLGVGSGTFAFVVILMTVASCVVLFAPLRYVKAWVLASVFLLSLLFEFIWK